MKNYKIAFGASIALALSMLSVPVHAALTNLVINGDFETTSAGNGMLNYNTVVTGWSSPTYTTKWGETHQSYNFVYAPNTADTSGANGWDGNVKLWGPNTGSNNGLTNSPTGGNFIASDGAYYQGAISQTITGLTAGQQYTLSFYQAGAQQAWYRGDNWEGWTVSLGNDSFSTTVMNNADKGFTGWQQVTHTFTATGSSQVLSFLATGGPQGLPPMSLLDGVSLTAPVPEPEEWAMMMVGAGLVGFQVKRKQAKATQA